MLGQTRVGNSGNDFCRACCLKVNELKPLVLEEPKSGQQGKKERTKKPPAFKEPKSGQSGSITPAISGAQKVGNGHINLAVLGVPNVQCGESVWPLESG